MANEISVSANFLASKNGVSVNVAPTKTLDMAGEDMLQGTQEIGTSAEQITFGAITGAPGYVVIKNLDDTNFVEIANDASMAEKYAKLLPGKFILYPPSSGTVYARADTAACNCLIAAVEA